MKHLSTEVSLSSEGLHLPKGGTCAFEAMDPCKFAGSGA